MKITPIDVRVHTQFAKERLRQSTLVIIRPRRAHRKAHNDGIDRIEQRRTREQKIFHRRRLEDTVIRGVQKQIEPRNISRNACAWAPCRFLHYKSVVIKAQPQREVPVSAMPLVLHVRRRLDVPTAIDKLKRRLRSRIKLSGVADGILQGFMNRTEDAVHARLPVMMPGVPGDVAANVAFAITAILGDYD